ncbi:hypothetical protein [Streptomyces sp. NRRL WC-3742]|nr:hypothetical protein [Streptomyces sp. NRRL WC-3742]
MRRAECAVTTPHSPAAAHRSVEQYRDELKDDLFERLVIDRITG